MRTRIIPNADSCYAVYLTYYTRNKTTVKIFKFTRSLALMKDSFRESIGVCQAENDFLISNIFPQEIFASNNCQMMLHQNHTFLAISRNSRCNNFKQNSQHLMFLLPFMTMEYPLILESHPKLFQKYVKVLSKKFKIFKFL